MGTTKSLKTKLNSLSPSANMHFIFSEQTLQVPSGSYNRVILQYFLPLMLSKPYSCYLNSLHLWKFQLLPHSKSHYLLLVHDPIRSSGCLPRDLVPNSCLRYIMTLVSTRILWNKCNILTLIKFLKLKVFFLLKLYNWNRLKNAKWQVRIYL